MKDEQFESITGFRPAEHQRQCAQALAEGRSVILRAPTGSGKSEAVWVPFLLTRGQSLPMRMIHTLPMRALVNQLEGRMRDYVKKLDNENEIRLAAMHGKRPESVLFYADAIFATLDQVVTSYACAPLSLSVRHGNIPAGAIPGSFLVFDEVHTFEPRLGLQSVLVLAERAHQMGIPFVIMSATLPTNFIRSLAERLGATPIEGHRLESTEGEPRHVTLRVLPEKLSDQTILDHAPKANRTLVVVNTVQRALDLYKRVRDRFQSPVILAHSRFYDTDRQTKEQQIENLFGKKAAQGRCLLIATQVVEVGLDISCDLLITELAPIDALVQRAGRCARWGGEGQVFVFTELETKRPYEEGLVVATEQALQNCKIDGRELTWELEKVLVDKVLDPYFEQWIKPEAAGKVLASLAEAAFTGDSNKAEQAVRDSLTIEVALHDCPKTLEADALKLPRVRLRPGVFRQFLSDKRNPQAWQVVVDRNPDDDWRAKVEFSPVGSKSRLMAGGYYIVDPKFAYYDAECGLRLGVAGQSEKPLSSERSEDRFPAGVPRLESLERHLNTVVQQFRQIVRKREEYGLKHTACFIGLSIADVECLLVLALLCHDLGKTNEDWQCAAWKTIDLWLEEDPKNANRLSEEERDLLNNRDSVVLARFPSLANRFAEPQRPPHATIGAYVMWDFLERNWGNWGKAAALAMAHHHSTRACQVPTYRLKPGWFDWLRCQLRQETSVELALSDVQAKLEQRSTTELPMTIPPFHQEKPYTLYVVLSRCLSLADRMAAGGGENAILDYEKWFRNL